MSSCGQRNSSRRLPACGYCGLEHETWKSTLLVLLRSVVIGMIIVFLAVWMAYLIMSDAARKELEEIEEEIRVYTRENGDVKELEVCHDRSDGEVDEGSVKRIVREELIVFDSDKTGRMDYAMQSLGGCVVSTPNTEAYPKCENHFEYLGFLSHWYTEVPGKDASVILDPSVIPGDCWPFAGRRGSVVVQLSAKIVVTHVALEHIPREISPTGDISSAPKIFSVVGLTTPQSNVGHSFGSFVYLDDGAAVQSFKVKHPGPPFKLLRFDFQDNYGNMDYTCVYRIRVHGHIE